MTAFPGATADRGAADYVLTGAPLDATTTFRPGARFGPERVRRFARPFDDYDRRTGADFSARGVHDAGDVAPWDAVDEYLDHLTAELRAATVNGAVPLAVGGEHTVSWAGVRATDPDTFVALDAHLDLRDAHGGNPLNHACVTRRVLDGGDADAPTADRAIVVGARTGSREEWERAARDDVTVVAPGDVDGWLADCDPATLGDVYLSVDVDAADPSVAPGTGTMEPFGLAARDLRDAVRTLAPAAVGFDVVEVNDRDDGQAAALGAKLVREFVHAHADGN